ncbi:unnamed protein product [Mycena citricolor]|uniref:Uncharacterized protein n=1 Tax=Mycena citricolor TaxID=2018698 RepID=A0AAD2HVS4_9AGAR|nr:unnamed protein product [Mycena citricolor]CAK5282015.1 unnamed protein product [Mycena citricolor]
MDADKVRPVFLCFVLLRILLAALCFLLFGLSISFRPHPPRAMQGRSFLSFSGSLGRLLVLGGLAAAAGAKVVPVLQPGFFFDYTPPGQSPLIPITHPRPRQALIHPPDGAPGPNPVAPYSMVVFTSWVVSYAGNLDFNLCDRKSITPFTIDAGNGLSFDWQVPFSPGTQYQICMWDSNGTPGGCEAMYTVIQNSTVATPQCHNVTFPTLLQVETQQTAAPGGPISQFGFIDQCTDILVTPKSGKPPFTFSVYPPLHPAFNITSNSMDTIDWTISLPWSYPFFISLSSADGQMWSNGPLHAGGFGPTDCLAPNTMPIGKAQSIAAAAGFGGALGAFALGGVVAFLYLRYRRLPPPQIDAFVHDSVTSRSDFSGASRNRSDSHTTMSSLGASSDIRRGRTYVLHHDAGRAPVTVITDSEEVVELPPRYHNGVVPGSRGSDVAGGSADGLPMRDKPHPPLPVTPSTSVNSGSFLSASYLGPP